MERPSALAALVADTLKDADFVEAELTYNPTTDQNEAIAGFVVEPRGDYVLLDYQDSLGNRYLDGHRAGLLVRPLHEAGFQVAWFNGDPVTLEVRNG